MEFKRFQHVERLGAAAVDGMDQGTVHVFPKIDGANASVWMGEADELCCGSRNGELDASHPLKGFYEYVKVNAEVFKKFFAEFPDHRLYGEWLVPHAIKHYHAEAFKKFYIFDVKNAVGDYICYDEYLPMLENFELLHVPRIAVLENPTNEQLYELAANDRFLVPDEKHGEGVVLKNYSYKNRFGKQNWGKIITSEFLETRNSQSNKKSGDAAASTSNNTVEQNIIWMYVTDAFLDKTILQVFDAEGATEMSPKLIPKLLHRVYDTLIYEETYNFVKKLKNPVVDFKRLQMLCVIRTKEYFKIGAKKTEE